MDYGSGLASGSPHPEYPAGVAVWVVGHRRHRLDEEHRERKEHPRHRELGRQCLPRPNDEVIRAVIVVDSLCLLHGLWPAACQCLSMRPKFRQAKRLLPGTQTAKPGLLSANQRALRTFEHHVHVSSVGHWGLKER